MIVNQRCPRLQSQPGDRVHSRIYPLDKFTTPLLQDCHPAACQPKENEFPQLARYFSTNEKKTPDVRECSPRNVPPTLKTPLERSLRPVRLMPTHTPLFVFQLIRRTSYPGAHNQPTQPRPTCRPTCCPDVPPRPLRVGKLQDP